MCPDLLGIAMTSGRTSLRCRNVLRG